MRSLRMNATLRSRERAIVVAHGSTTRNSTPQHVTGAASGPLGTIETNGAKSFAMSSAQQ